MFEIIGAITTKYGDTDSMELAGGLFFRHPSANPTMPYGVFDVEADAPEENTGTGYAQAVRVTIEIYAESAADFQTQATAFKTALYQKSLTLENGKIIAARLLSEEIVDLENDDDASRTAAGQPQVYYQMVLEYTQTQVRS